MPLPKRFDSLVYATSFINQSPMTPFIAYRQGLNIDLTPFLMRLYWLFLATAPQRLQTTCLRASHRQVGKSVIRGEKITKAKKYSLIGK
jgi:hypothetical protein